MKMCPLHSNVQNNDYFQGVSLWFFINKTEEAHICMLRYEGMTPHKGAEILGCIMGTHTLSENKLKMLLKFNMWAKHLLLLKENKKRGEEP